MSLNRILTFDLNRITSWDVGRLLQWPIPPLLLKGTAGWFLAAITLDVNGLWVGGGGAAVFVAAASAGALMLPDLVRRARRAAERPSK